MSPKDKSVALQLSMFAGFLCFAYLTRRVNWLSVWRDIVATLILPVTFPGDNGPDLTIAQGWLILSVLTLMGLVVACTDIFTDWWRK